ncbi:MAG: hypothetical protein VZR09_06165 [Candidatus Gastranaerophilaceae bacterium]|nr:hypothetical protein [Candidatus Gastranaerophilaceae bacterium]
MKLAFLLLPNLYDIFTLMVIGYAFVLNQKGELQIPFAVACGLIYVATRLGIFAGKLLHKILGQPQAVAAEGAAPDPKMAVWNFGPQIAFVLIFQLIMALCCLPHSSAVANVPKEQLQMQEQNQSEAPNSEVVSQDAVNTEETAAKTSDNVQNSENQKVADNNNISKVDKWLSESDEDEVASKTQKAATTNSTKKVVTKKRTYRAKKAVASEKQTYVDSSYEVPDKTLKSVGVTLPATSSSNYNNRSNQIAAANGTYNVSGLTPKRYPGDDNPINTTWGYYKQTPQQQNQSVRQSNSVQTKSSRVNIPANTLRAIGY